MSTTDKLLCCGILAGPVSLALYAAQALTREGYDPTRHPMSLLALGESGWVQMVNFVLTGTLYLACAAGLRRALRDGPGQVWAPRLIAAFGAGMVIAGVFTTDPGAGFPAGAPTGAPEMSWHGVLHEFGFAAANLAVLGACLVFARRFRAQRRHGWFAASLAVPAAILLVVGWPDLETFSLRAVAGTAIAYGFVGAVAAATRPTEPARRTAAHT
jgi:hypothetical protein